MLHRDRQLLARLAPRGERRVGALDAQADVAADELEVAVAPQHARQQARLAEDLEAVADPEHRAAVGRERAHRVQHRGEARDRAAAKVVAVREAAGKHDCAGPARQLGLGVPDELGVGAESAERPRGVPVVVRAREDEHGDLRPRRSRARRPRSRSSRSAGSRAAPGTCAPPGPSPPASSRRRPRGRRAGRPARRRRRSRACAAIPPPPRPAGRGCRPSGGRAR